jgi:hypothetical protein
LRHLALGLGFIFPIPRAQVLAHFIRPVTHTKVDVVLDPGDYGGSCGGTLLDTSELQGQCMDAFTFEGSPEQYVDPSQCALLCGLATGCESFVYVSGSTFQLRHVKGTRRPEDGNRKTKRRPGWSSSFCPPRKGSIASHER